MPEHVELSTGISLRVDVAKRQKIMRAQVLRSVISWSIDALAHEWFSRRPSQKSKVDEASQIAETASKSD